MPILRPEAVRRAVKALYKLSANERKILRELNDEERQVIFDVFCTYCCKPVPCYCAGAEEE
ncbi:MAG: hypothetical protein Q7R73_02605 [bacterium]|nr:hypothetical protein [bacterium]